MLRRLCFAGRFNEATSSPSLRFRPHARLSKPFRPRNLVVVDHYRLLGKTTELPLWRVSTSRFAGGRNVGPRTALAQIKRVPGEGLEPS